MSRTMKASLLIEAVDRASAPVRALIGRVQALVDRARSLSGVAARVTAIAGAVASLASGLSFAQPVNAAAAFEGRLRDIAITAGRTGIEVDRLVARNARSYQDLALRVGQSSENVAKAAQVLIASGLDESLVERLLPTVGRVATAAGADIEAAARSAVALNQQLRIGPEQMERGLAMLVAGGKLGMAEFREVAPMLPALAAQMGSLGSQGERGLGLLVGMLQAARRGTGDTATAANNLLNLLRKFNTEDTVKNFRELGVDLPRVMQNAAARGIDPVEAAIMATMRATRVAPEMIQRMMTEVNRQGLTGAAAAEEIRRNLERSVSGRRLAQLFPDAESMQAFMQLLTNFSRFRDETQQIRAVGPEVIQEDFKSRMGGIQPQLDRLSETTGQVRDRIGFAFASNLPLLTQFADGVRSGIAALDGALGEGVLDRILSGAGFALLLVAAFGAAAIAAPVFVAGLKLAAGAALLLGGGIAALFTPLGLLAALLLATGLIIAANWGAFAARFGALWQSAKTIAAGGLAAITGLLTGDRRLLADGAAAMARGFTNALRAGLDIGRDVARTAARGIESALSAIDGRLGTNLAGGFRRAIDFVSGLGPRAGEAATAIGRAFTSGLGDLPARAFTAIADAATRLGQRIGELMALAGQVEGRFSGWRASLDPASGGMADLAVQAAALVVGLRVLWAVLVASPIGRVVALVIELLANWAAWEAAATRLAEGVGKAVGGLVANITGLLTGDLKLASDGARAFFNGLEGIAAGGLGLAEQAVKTGVNLISGALGALDGILGTDFKARWDRAAEAVGTAFRELPGQLTRIGGEIIQGLWDGMKAKFDEFMGWVLSIPARITGALGSISLPSFMGRTPGAPQIPGQTTPGTAPGQTAPALRGSTMDGFIQPMSFPDGRGRGASGERSAGLSPAAMTLARAEAPRPARAEVGGTVRVVVEGPGRVAGVTSTNPAVPLAASRGDVLGRA